MIKSVSWNVYFHKLTKIITTGKVSCSAVGFECTTCHRVIV